MQHICIDCNKRLPSEEALKTHKIAFCTRQPNLLPRARDLIPLVTHPQQVSLKNLHTHSIIPMNQRPATKLDLPEAPIKQFIDRDKLRPRERILAMELDDLKQRRNFN